mgnify:CR=1 FL=1
MRKYKQIQVKPEVLESLKKAVDIINERDSNKSVSKVTIAGLVSRLAEAYDTQLVEDAIGNSADWTTIGHPIIVDGDTKKHYEEMVTRDAKQSTLDINSAVRESTMRYKLRSIEKEEKL